MVVKEFVRANPPKAGETRDQYLSRVAPDKPYTLWSQIKALLVHHGMKQGMNGLNEFLRLDLGENKKTKIKDGDTITYIYDGGMPITSEAQALEFFEVDTDRYEVSKFVVNSWDVHMRLRAPEQVVRKTNYQVKLFLKRKEGLSAKDITRIKKMCDAIAPAPNLVNPGSGKAVVSLADFHYGLKSDGRLLSPGYSKDKLGELMSSAVSLINSGGYEDVTLLVLGDLIESFSGLNHPSTWRELESSGMGAIIGVFEMFCRNLFDKIHNVKKIYVVSGNHDRITPDKGDLLGDGAGLFSYLMGLRYPGIPVEFDPLMVRFAIDDVFYLGHHGNYFKGKKPYDIAFDYGDQSKVNIVVSAHEHHREDGGRVSKGKQGIHVDTMRVRGVKIPSFVTGNFYSQSLGAHSNPGLTIFEHSYGNVQILQYSL